MAFPHMDRRAYITQTVGAVALVAVSGCLADSSDESDDSDTNDENDTGDNSDGILIEYSTSDPKTHDEIPDEIIEHPNPEDFYWVVVEFELTNGSFDVGDIMGLTQIRAAGTEHFTRGVIITSPDNEILTSSDDEYMMAEGTVGEAYYRISEESDDSQWVIEQLQNQHQSLEAESQ